MIKANKSHKSFYYLVSYQVLCITTSSLFLNHFLQFLPIRTFYYQESSFFFGRLCKQLVKQLRQVGYAVREYTPENTKGPPAGDQTSILKFDYIVDVPVKATTRVTLLIDNHILTRGYKLIDGVYMPIGDWAYKGDTGGKQT
ncbi:MAG: hypothetical protein PUP46_00215 [Endozoicomonas sp. (ex Botrylloides leachii)]|nr:hypothetical protein [Endozoicomonas sp. (ex Botrylloides leachii)]